MKRIIEFANNVMKKQNIVQPGSLFQNIFKQIQNSDKLQQNHVDIYKGALLLRCNEWYEKNSSQFPPQPIIDEFIKQIESVDMIKLHSEVQTSINAQIEKMFHNIDLVTISLENKTNDPDYTELLTTALMRDIGFVLDVKKSKINNAGYGVFTKGGYINPGAVIAMFPGKVHLPEYLTDKYLDAHIFPDDNFFVMGRLDGTLIDGRTANDVPYNPYALGHLVNHPPRYAEPNVLQLMYDFPGDPFQVEVFPKHLQKYIPNTFAKPPTWSGTPDRSFLMKTVVLVACKHIVPGDEVLMDYRLNPELPSSSWYIPVDVEHSKKRWTKAFY